ncbi:MAG: HD domain-containing protein, partial [Actinomycetota bacterium]|nr:HD domain-containing protein [Actinomycetota bacterium]
MPQSRDVLLQALRERTPDLGEHVRGVRELAEAIARTLRASESEIAAVGSTADLHDIGKMAIPRTILNKPGPLSDVEWGFIHRHTIIGARIVSAAPSLAEVALAVRGTHERWDGC